MSVTAKTQALYDSLVKLVSQQNSDCDVVSLQTVKADSDVARLAKDVLINEVGGLIPTASGLLKRKGCELTTVKRSDEPGNALVFIDVNTVRVCVYVAPSFLTAVQEAVGTTAPQAEKPTGFFEALLKKLFG